MRDLSGKRVLLTGATGGLGRTLARVFGAEVFADFPEARRA